MDAIHQSEKGVLFRRNLGAVACVALPGLLVLGAMPLLLAGSGSEPAWFPLLSVAICGSWIGVGVVVSRNAWPIEERGALRVSAEGIFLDGAQVVHADEIVAASFANAGWQRPVVRLKLRGRLLLRYLRVRDEPEARAILATLQLDAAHTRASFALPWGPFRWGVVIVFYMFLWIAAPFVLILGVLLSRGHGDMSPLGSAAMALVGAALIAAYWLLWWRSRQLVTIGADGVLVSQWGRTRFIGYGEILAIRPRRGPTVRGMVAASEAFDLELSSGERIGFYTARERTRLGLFEGDVVAQRIRDGMALGVRGVHDEGPRIQLSGRLSDLRRIGGGANVGMRTAPADVEGLWRLVEDPAAPPADRAAAAAALSASPELDARERLRAAAEATAMPALCAAIQAAADGDDAELEAALDVLGEEKRRS
jgi:hypothetical protein